MTIIIEADKNWTIGIDWFKYIKGVRLGFIAIHVCFKPLEDILNSENYTKE
jgi:hypothetical protein